MPERPFGADFFLIFGMRGYRLPDVITRVKFQVDWSKSMESTAYWFFKVSHDRRQC